MDRSIRPADQIAKCSVMSTGADRPERRRKEVGCDWGVFDSKSRRFVAAILRVNSRNAVLEGLKANREAIGSRLNLDLQA
jgi:hypothetical protein